MKKDVIMRIAVIEWKAFYFVVVLIAAICWLTIVNRTQSAEILSNSVEVSLYRIFELPVVNDKTYNNKFTDVELTATYTSPSGNTFEFPGFFDGDGNGGGNYQKGNVWKLRFMPNELGEWTYEYKWSDTTTGGSGTFNCVAEGAGKGVLQPYKSNPRWLAYNGTDPVWLKSYYETGHGAIGQDFAWIVENVYSKFVDEGYNHLQVNWLLSLCCFYQYYQDGPEPETLNLYLYRYDLFTSMNFDVWRRMEQHLGWLNDHDVGVHMFLGVDGSRNNGPDWGKLSSEEKDWFAEYMVARLAPFANLAGWNFVWEVPGDRVDRELGFARLIQKYDIFNHLRTYQDEKPRDNEYDRPEYNFAAVENHGYSEKSEWGRAWTHHKGARDGYISGKPVFMSEGNALWRRYWHIKINAQYGTVDQDDLRQSAWACVTAGASFTWCGHGNTLSAKGDEGLPFYGDHNSYTRSARYIDILTRVMNEEVVFYHMTPQDSLLSGHDSKAVWCLAETGRQYLVFAIGGKSFTLNVASGQYNNNIWLNAETGASQNTGSISGGSNKKFTSPNTSTDWVLILRTDESLIVDEETRNTDTEQLQKDFILYQNFPNPFNPQTTIQYDLIQPGYIKLTVYNLKGRAIAVLENGYKQVGQHSVVWNTKGLASGIYFYKIKIGKAVQVKKMVLQK